MTLAQTLQWLSQKLYPQNGRAWRMADGNIFFRLHRAINLSFARARAAALNIQDAQLPDNPNFTIDDAHAWYKRLGIYDSGLVPLADMKLAIAQKLSFPITPLNKQSLQYIQDQLQAAGFNVFVYQNKFSDGMGGFITKTPGEVLGSIPAGNAVLNNFTLGDVYLDEQWIDSGITLCANYLEEDKDADFITANQYRYTFFIAGATIDTFANVLASRKIEFRQLILKLKAANMCAFSLLTMYNLKLWHINQPTGMVQ
jgi:hypothetical protein